MSVTVNDVTKSLGGRIILRGVSASADKGNPLVIRGASGCGKTTLLRIISGLDTPDSGSVCVDDEVIGAVFQEPRLLEWCNVLENVIFGTKNVPNGKENATKLLEKLGLGGCEEMYPNELSGGMKQRVSIARALFHGGAVLLDEPMNGLDPELKEVVLGIFREYSENHTVIMVTHSQDDADKLTTKNTLYL